MNNIAAKTANTAVTAISMIPTKRYFRALLSPALIAFTARTVPITDIIRHGNGAINMLIMLLVKMQNLQPYLMIILNISMQILLLV